MGAFYPLTLAKFWTALAAGDPIFLALLDNTYTYAAGHDFYNDVSASVLGTPIEVTNPTFIAGLLDSPDRPFNYTGVGIGDIVTQAVVYIDTGVAGTSPVVIHIDQRSDGPMISLTGDGTDVIVDWPLGSLGSI